MMVVGLQGSGKTTSTAKLAKWLENNKSKKVLMASLIFIDQLLKNNYYYLEKIIKFLLWRYKKIKHQYKFQKLL